MQFGISRRAGIAASLTVLLAAVFGGASLVRNEASKGPGPTVASVSCADVPPDGDTWYSCDGYGCLNADAVAPGYGGVGYASAECCFRNMLAGVSEQCDLGGGTVDPEACVVQSGAAADDWYYCQDSRTCVQIGDFSGYCLPKSPFTCGDQNPGKWPVCVTGGTTCSWEDPIGEGTIYASEECCLAANVPGHDPERYAPGIAFLCGGGGVGGSCGNGIVEPGEDCDPEPVTSDWYDSETQPLNRRWCRRDVCQWNACSNGRDDDADGKVDLADDGCTYQNELSDAPFAQERGFLRRITAFLIAADDAKKPAPGKDDERKCADGEEPVKVRDADGKERVECQKKALACPVPEEGRGDVTVVSQGCWDAVLNGGISKAAPGDGFYKQHCCKQGQPGKDTCTATLSYSECFQKFQAMCVCECRSGASQNAAACYQSCITNTGAGACNPAVRTPDWCRTTAVKEVCPAPVEDDNGGGNGGIGAPGGQGGQGGVIIGGEEEEEVIVVTETGSSVSSGGGGTTGTVPGSRSSVRSSSRTSSSVRSSSRVSSSVRSSVPSSVRSSLRSSPRSVASVPSSRASSSRAACDACTAAMCSGCAAAGDSCFGNGTQATCFPPGTEVADPAWQECCQPPPVCGDGRKEGDEQCDNGAANTDEANTYRTVCRTDCTLSRCGDGIVGVREPPDPDCRVFGGLSEDYRARLTALSMCRTEECDDGNSVDNDACSNACAAARCGDNIVQKGVFNGLRFDEQCDDGNLEGGDGCSATCTPESRGCGDGILGREDDVTPGDDAEECDDGDRNDNNFCTNACRFAVCGDGIVNGVPSDPFHPEYGPLEECDDGNRTDFDGCSTSCRFQQVTCGDGERQGDEQCDESVSFQPNSCRPMCKTPRCGDGVVDGNKLREGFEEYVPWQPQNEQCDPGSVCVGGAKAGMPCGCGLYYDMYTYAPRDAEGIPLDIPEEMRDCYRPGAWRECMLAGGQGCAPVATPDCTANCKLPRQGASSSRTSVTRTSVTPPRSGSSSPRLSASSQPSLPPACTRCSACGQGLLNTCDSAECAALGPCVYTPGTFGGTCAPNPAQCTPPPAGSSRPSSTPSSRRSDSSPPTVVYVPSSRSSSRGFVVPPPPVSSSAAPFPPASSSPYGASSVPFARESSRASITVVVEQSSAPIGCRSDSECPGGFRCLKNLCVKLPEPPGGPCDRNVACATNRCENGVCLGCTADSECPAGAVCVAGSCRMRDGAECVVDAQCAASACVEGTCVTPPRPPVIVAGDVLADRGTCGDGERTTGEECDDRNRRDFDGCSADCLLERGSCGDGTVQSLLGEQCEPATHDPALPYGCGANCRFVSSLCGNGALDPGEECDAGARNSFAPNAFCRPHCALARCGDGVVDALQGEQCDDGNRLSGDGCSKACVRERGAPQPLTAQTFPVTPQVPVQVSGPPLAQAWQAVPPVTASSGPASLAVMAAGAAGGLAWARRRKK